MAGRYNDYSGLANGFGRSGQMISQHIMQMPRIRHQLQQEAIAQAQRQQVAEAQVENYKASSRKGNAEAALTEDNLSAAREAQSIFDDPTSFEQTPSGGAGLSGRGLARFQALMVRTRNPGSTGAGAKALFGAQQAPYEAEANRVATGARNDATVAGRSATALDIAKIGATGTAAPGSAIYDKRTGQIIGQVPSAAGARELYDTQTETYPAVEAVPGTPAIPASTNWLGRVTSEVPGTPAVPYQPERKVTKRLGRSEVGTRETRPSSNAIGAAGIPRPAFTEEADNYPGPEEPDRVGNVQRPTSNAQPGTNAPAAAPQPNYAQALLDEANKAISMGADPAKVRARLIEKGIQLQ